MRRIIASILIAGIFMLLGGFAVIYTGAYDVAATAPHWPTGTQTITRSASFTAAPFVAATSSASSCSAARRRVAAERAVAMIVRAAPQARAARAIEEPMRPTPISASRSNKGSLTPPHP